MATQAQVEFAQRLYEEREIDFPEDFGSLSVSDASAEIDVLLSQVETGPVTAKQLSEITDLLAELGPRNDGSEWNIPENRGHAAAFIRNLQKWVKGKQYAGRKAAAAERLAERGVNVTSAPASPAVAEGDDIPF